MYSIYYAPVCRVTIGMHDTAYFAPLFNTHHCCHGNRANEFKFTSQLDRLPEGARHERKEMPKCDTAIHAQTIQVARHEWNMQ